MNRFPLRVFLAFAAALESDLASSLYRDPDTLVRESGTERTKASAQLVLLNRVFKLSRKKGKGLSWQS
jgi:hypothetical protein